MSAYAAQAEARQLWGPTTNLWWALGERQWEVRVGGAVYGKGPTYLAALDDAKANHWAKSYL